MITYRREATNELLPLVPETGLYQLSKEDRIFIVEKFAVHGSVVNVADAFKNKCGDIAQLTRRS